MSLFCRIILYLYPICWLVSDFHLINYWNCFFLVCFCYYWWIFIFVFKLFCSCDWQQHSQLLHSTNWQWLNKYTSIVRPALWRAIWDQVAFDVLPFMSIVAMTRCLLFKTNIKINGQNYKNYTMFRIKQ